jgi:hypothetical protein
MEILLCVILCAFIVLVVVTIYSDRRERIVRLQGYADMTGTMRMRGESLSVWENRIVAAHTELFRASGEFLAAASELQLAITQPGTGGRVVTYSLPANHPASIRLSKAKGKL